MLKKGKAETFPYISLIKYAGNKAFSFFGPVKPLIWFYLCGLTLFFVFRLIFFISNYKSVNQVEGVYRIFLIGIRMDTIVMAYLLIPFLVALTILPKSTTVKLRKVFALLFAGLFVIFVFLEISTFPFIDEFFGRPGRLFVEQFGISIEIISMAFNGFLIETLAAFAICLLLFVIVFWKSKGIFGSYNNFPLTKRVCLFLIVGIYWKTGN